MTLTKLLQTSFFLHLLIDQMKCKACKFLNFFFFFLHLISRMCVLNEFEIAPLHIYKMFYHIYLSNSTSGFQHPGQQQKEK
jgi:hypothetical protein